MALDYDFKRCFRCKEQKPLAAYARRARSKDGRQAYCDPCRADYYRENQERLLAQKADYRERNAEAARAAVRRWQKADTQRTSDTHRASKYGLTVEQLRELIGDGSCQLCGATEIPGKRRHHIDHDHSCCPLAGESCGFCVRGLLCAGCNSQLLPRYERLPADKRDSQYLNEYLRSRFLGRSLRGTGV